MLETIGKKSKKVVLIRVFLCTAAIVGIMVFSKLAPIKFIAGPGLLDMKKDFSELEGQYVEYDLNLVFGSYVESISVDSDTRRERKDAMGYIISDYDTGITFAMTVPWKDTDQINMLEDDTWAWLDGDSSRLSEMKVRGTIEPLTGQKLKYFNETIGEMGFEDLSYVKAYSLEKDKIGGVEMLWVYILLAASVCLLAFAIFSIISHRKTKGMKFVTKFLNANPEAALESVEEDFESAVNVGGSIWIGKNYTFYMAGTQVKLFKNADAVWAYYYKRTGRYAVSQVQVYFANKNVHNLNIAERLYPQIIESYQSSQPHMILGYSKELKKLYNKNMDEFLNIQYNTRRYEEDSAAAKEPVENAGNDFDNF